MVGGPVTSGVDRILRSSHRLARIRQVRLVVFGATGGLIGGWLIDRPYAAAAHNPCLATLCMWSDVHEPPGAPLAVFLAGFVAVITFIAATVRRTSSRFVIFHDAVVVGFFAVALYSAYEGTAALKFDELPLPPPLWLPVVAAPLIFFGVHLLSGCGIPGFVRGLALLVAATTALHFAVVAVGQQDQREAHRAELAGLRIPRVLPRMPGWQVTDVWVDWGSTSMQAVLSGPDGAEMRITLGSPDDRRLASPSDFSASDPGFFESRADGLIVRVLVIGPADPPSVARQAVSALAPYSADDLVPAAVQADSVDIILMP
jgi:hypothetical protein